MISTDSEDTGDGLTTCIITSENVFKLKAAAILESTLFRSSFKEAVLGAQLVITLVTVSIIQKLSPHFSFAKWLLCSTGLRRYLHPTNADLKNLAGIPRDKQKSKTNLRDKTNNFLVPRSIDIHLDSVNVSENDVVQLRYFTEFQWLVDFSIYAALVYILSETYYYFYPIKTEVNLSMVWCLLVIFFAIKLLSSLTILYFKNEESIGERSMCIVACFVYLLIAMIVLVIDEQILETGLEQAYEKFNQSAAIFLAKQGLSSSGPASKIVLKFFIALSCGLLGSLFTFPGLRMARMHWDSLRYCQERKFLQILLNLSFALPFISVVLWIRPITRDYLTERTFGGMENPLMTPHAFETARLIIVILVVILRCALLPIYLQSYLNIAYDRIENLKKEGGRITNVELQQKISSIFYYLCVVTLQFTAPLIVCAYFTLMYKSLGGFSWTGIFKDPVFQNDTAEEIFSNNINNAEISNSGNRAEELSIFYSAQDLQTSLKNFKEVFSTEVYKGFLGFATWWSYFVLFATSALGLLYQTYFTKT